MTMKVSRMSCGAYALRRFPFLLEVSERVCTNSTSELVRPVYLNCPDVGWSVRNVEEDRRG